MNELQYFFINRRIVRDRVVTHAVRQACEAISAGPKTPGYVLYLDIDPREVDVNVHPAKQEVRFNQARWVHDFIYHALTRVLAPSASSSSDVSSDRQNASAVKEMAQASRENRYAAGSHHYVDPDSAFSEHQRLTKQTEAVSLSFHDMALLTK